MTDMYAYSIRQEHVLDRSRYTIHPDCKLDRPGCFNTCQHLLWSMWHNFWFEQLWQSNLLTYNQPYQRVGFLMENTKDQYLIKLDMKYMSVHFICTFKAWKGKHCSIIHTHTSPVFTWWNRKCRGAINTCRQGCAKQHFQIWDLGHLPKEPNTRMADPLLRLPEFIAKF